MCSCSHFNSEGGKWGLAGAVLGVKVGVFNTVRNEKMKAISIQGHGTQVVDEDYQNT